ncbi:hypothetical protein BAME_15330 [Bacillus sp. M 2-6]|nr:hypothetical protein BAME_15330 [Bacillus sp. M 2-6]
MKIDQDMKWKYEIKTQLLLKDIFIFSYDLKDFLCDHRM